jgi:hypothetical protein
MRQRTCGQCLCALLVLKTIAVQSAASQSGGSSGTVQPMLPVPSGQYSIGRQAFDFVDTTRPDQFSTDPAKHRELMVYVWYPTTSHFAQKERGEYVPGAVQLDENPAAQRVMRNTFGTYWPLIVSGRIASHAISNGVPAAKRGGFPIVFFCHGSGSTTTAYTAEIEDLVSHGYVVVSIDRSAAVLFPDGSVRLTRSFPPTPGKDPLQAMIETATEETQIGAEGLRFVLDALQHGKISLVKNMDLTRVAAVGHSAGGTLSVRACQLDLRIKACISEEGEVNPVGAFFDYPDHNVLGQPFLLIEVDWRPTDDLLARMHESRRQWDDYLAHKRRQLESCTAGSYHVVLSGAGMTHASFSDGLLLSALPGSVEASAALSNLLLTETIDRSFLDKYLKNEPAPVLDQPERTPSGVGVEYLGR